MSQFLPKKLTSKMKDQKIYNIQHEIKIPRKFVHRIFILRFKPDTI